MIPRRFYDTDPNYDAYSFMGIRSTYELKSIPIDTQNFTQAYWLGWVGWETLPQQYHISNSTFENGVVTFTDITKPENVPIGFSTHPTPSLTLANYTAYAIEYDANQSKWYTPTWINSAGARGAACDNFHLPNAYDINTGSWGRLKLLFFGLSTDNTTEIQASAEVPYMTFAAGTAFTATIFDSGSYNNFTFNVTIDDISNYSVFTKTINGTEFSIVLGMYTMPYVRDCGYNSSAAGYNCVHPMLQVHTLDGFPYVMGVTNPFDFQFRDDFYWGSSGGVSYNGQGCRIGWDGSIISLGSYLHGSVYDWFGGYVGSFNLADMPPLQLRLIVPDGANFYLRGIGRSDFFIMGRIFTHKEILHSLSLLPRLTDGTTNRYENSSSYFYGVVDPETGEFKGSLIDGSDITKLVDWQKINHNIEDNTITTDDIPEYVPPTPGDAENIGDKITRPATLGIGGTNGFVTLYAMRKTDISQLGELLWTSFVDTDYWKNYLFSLALDTGTFSLAGLLNFFVSCRVYPFSMANVAGCSSFGQDMYVGTGIVPLHFTTNLHTLGSMCDYIYGGWYEIPRCYNDWRDYVNTEIILYIPYCGTLKLNPGDVIGNRIDITYAVDFATGGCIAYADMTTGDGQGFPVGALPGQIGADIPLTATAAGEVAARFIGDALNVGGIVAGEGANVASGALGAAMGKPSAGGAGNVLSGTAGIMGGLPAAMAVDMAVPMAKQSLQMLSRGAVQAPMLSGGRGFASFGAPQKPYVQIRRGIYPEISGLDDIAGKPAATTTTIGALTGFVQGDVKTDGLSCPENEKATIRQLIANGIYV